MDRLGGSLSGSLGDGGDGGDGGKGAWSFRGVLHTVGAYFGSQQQDDDGATVAHLGESNRFYYDEELKKWIDPQYKNGGGGGEDQEGSGEIVEGTLHNGTITNRGSGSLLQSPSGNKRNRRNRPRIDLTNNLPPSDAMLGPTPPPSVTPRHSSTRSNSPSLEQLAFRESFRATSPPAEVAMALAMVNSPKSGSNNLRKKDYQKNSQHNSTPEDRPPGWTQHVTSQRDALKSPPNDAGKKRNRFKMSQRKQGKLRSRYVDTFEQ
jgi:hypothetical protein